jgi:diguanylate cyclase (GGDEF)-like protein/PAS domain S-box-containing protein
MDGPLLKDAQAAARVAEALLREYPDAMVCGLANNGLIVPVPQSVGLWGQEAIEGRALIDGVVAADRETVIEVWMCARRDGAAEGKVRLLNKPSRWVTLHFLDLREEHEVILGILIPTEDVGEDGGRQRAELAPAAPRFSTITEDEGGNVLDCDETFTQMFGYPAHELIGKHVLDQIHPDEQARAIEGWLAMLSTRRAQHTRLRRRCKDGTWKWVDTTLHNYLNQPERNYVLVENIDVSAEMAFQEALQEREELLRRLTDGMPVGLLHVDTAGNIIYNNTRLLDILGCAAVTGSPEPAAADTPEGEQPAAARTSAGALLQTLTQEGMAAFDAALSEVLGTGVDRDVEVDIVLPSGIWRHALMSLRALLRPTGEVSGAITCVLDVTESARARRELEKRATFDALTGCHNRSSILSAVQLELEREDATETGVVYIDLDNFKPVNDTLGHSAGDELLVLVAQRLKLASRANDVVGRLGGDEFLLLLREIPAADIASQAAHRISEALRRPFDLSCGTVKLGASVGVACTDSERLTAEELIKRSDTAMYRSKEAGQSLPVLSAAGPG